MAARREVAVAATEPRAFRVRNRRTLPLLVAGLGALGARHAQAQSRVDLLNLIYQEDGGRTQVLEQMLLLHQDLGDYLGVADLTLTHDAISGASPTGAYPKLDVTTSASGTTSKGAFPLARDDNHRNAGSFAYGRKFGAHLPTVDVSYGKEDDYVAREAGVSDQWTMLRGRGVLHYGLSMSRDLSEPITNHLHLPKNSLSYAAGWTWILGAEDLVDFSLSRTHLDGYLDEPYKVVPVGAALAPDHRPDTRTRDAALLKYGHYFDWDGALKASYRYYKDDWALRAHTLDLVYDQHAFDDWIITPELRYYTQNAASFFGNFFLAPQPYMSSDYRLSSFSSVMGGLSLSYAVRDGLSLKLGASYEMAKGRDRVTPLASGPGPGPGAVYSGPSSSSADLNKTILTFGLSWRY